MDLQALAVYVAAASAIFSAFSAGANWYNANTFHRQLRNTTLDGCVAAASGLQGAVHKTIELKENRRKDVLLEQILSAHEDAWAKWVVLTQAFRVAQRYNQALRDPKFNPPDELSRLLSELTPNLHDLEWTPHGDDDPKDIRKEVDRIVHEIQRRAGLA